MSFGPTHYRTGGTRGGQDQFKWDDVKTDKYRENYLGHSVNAPVGRWQKGKDLLWYTKSSNGSNTEAQKMELAAIRERDEMLMNEALGIIPKRSHIKATNQLDPVEMKELLKKGTTERDLMCTDRVEGLGAAPSLRVTEHLPKKTLVEKYKEGNLQEEMVDRIPGHDVPLPQPDVHSIEVNEKKLKKERKKEKKKEKKKRKERKMLAKMSKPSSHALQSKETFSLPRSRSNSHDSNLITSRNITRSRSRRMSRSPRRTSSYRDSPTRRTSSYRDSPTRRDSEPIQRKYRSRSRSYSPRTRRDRKTQRTSRSSSRSKRPHQ